MNETKETGCTPRLRKWAVGKLLPFITACPHILRSETNVDMFIDDLSNATKKLDKYSTEVLVAMDNLLPFISICSHLFKPGIGIEAFTEELGKVALKFDLDFNEQRNKEDK